MNTNQQLLITQLQALSNTMQLAHDAKIQQIEMCNWVSKGDAPVLEEIQPMCGYAACVCGYQALQPDLSMFKGAELARSKAHMNTMLRGVAAKIADDLERTAGDAFYFSEERWVANAIYGGIASHRECNAIDSGLFTQNEVKYYSHLTTNAPTPLEAKAFIDECIVRVTKLIEEDQP